MTKEEKFNLENAANTPIIKDLKGLLSALTVKDLRSIGDMLMIYKLSGKPKKELIKIIYNALTDRTKLISVIEKFTDQEFLLLKKLLANKGTIQDNNISVQVYHYLYMIGMVFIFRREDKFYISMTDDIYNVVKKIDLNRFNKIIDENSKVYYLVRAMVELYGVFSFSELDYYYSLYYGNGEELDIPVNVLFFCDRLDNINIVHTEDNIYFINNILDCENLEPLLDTIISRQSSIKRKPIKLEELLKYSNYNYYEETESKNKFKKYLQKQNISSVVIEDIIKIISDMYRLGSKYLGASIEMLQDYGVELNDKNAQEVLNCLMDIYNNSRIWENNGWTPIEIRKEYN